MLRVSEKCILEGLILAIIKVNEFPPNESLRINVNLLSRYGTCLNIILFWEINLTLI